MECTRAWIVLAAGLCVAGVATSAAAAEPAWLEISAGDQHTCALREPGVVECWGRGDNGQLWMPDHVYTSVSAGYAHTCAVTETGAVQCWGCEGHDHGQCTAPEGVFTAVASGDVHSCGLREDGQVECWGCAGAADAGQCDTPRGTFTRVVVGRWISCASSKRDKVQCWGAPTERSIRRKALIRFDVGESAVCGLSRRGAVHCWGIPTEPGAPDPSVAVGVGDGFACGIDDEQQLGCWGEFAQPGPPPGRFDQLSVGSLHACALDVEGTLACWGSPADGRATPPGSAGFADAGEGLSREQFPRPSTWRGADRPTTPLLDDVTWRRFWGREDAWVEFQRAVSLLERNQFDRASPIIDELHESIGTGAYAEELWLLAAEMDLLQPDPAQARSSLALWRDAYPDSRLLAYATLLEARRLHRVASNLASGHTELPPEAEAAYRTALAAFETVLADFPDRTDEVGAALHDMTIVHHALAEPEQSLARFEELLERCPEHRLVPRALYREGNRAWTDQDHTRAREFFQRLADEHPDDGLAKRARRNVTAIGVVGQPAPELVVDHWLEDETSLESLRGEVVVLVFWNEWCPHCRRVMPDLVALDERFADQGLRVVLVTKHTKGQTDERIRDFLERSEASLPCAVEPDAFTSTSDYAITGVPAAAVIDREGVVVWRNHPARLTDEWLEGLLGD